MDARLQRRIQRYGWDKAAPHDERFWQASRFTEPVRDEAHAEYLASIAAWQADSGYAIPGEFVVAEGERPA